MATTTSITTTYAGESAGKWISAALLSGSTLANDLITIMPNVKHKAVVKSLNTDDIVKDASCDYTDTSTVTIAERIITPEQQQVNLTLCKKDFQSDWDAISMGYSSHDVIPKSFADHMISYVAGKVAQRTENSIWEGDTSTSGQFDGFSKILKADSDVSDISATASTSANVVTELGKVLDAVPSAVYGQEDLTIYASPNIIRSYVRALGGFAATIGGNGVDSKGTMWYGGQALSFDGVRLVQANGLANNTAVAAQKSNLFFGTGLLSDQNEVKILDMADLDGSMNVRVVMRFSAGVQFGTGADIVYYAEDV